MSNSPYWINHKKKIVLIWSPKCACTSLHHGFIRNICENFDKKDPRLIAGECNYIKSNYELIPKDYFIYMGIRNPYDRIISCYFNKFILYESRKLNKNNLESFSNELLQDINVDYDNLTFNKMLYGIKKLITTNAKIDSHFNTQININNYNKIKDHPNLLLFDINNIPDILKINMKLNETKKIDNIIIEDLCDTKTKDININSLSKKNFMKSINLIKEIYKKDYQIFKKHNFLF